MGAPAAIHAAPAVAVAPAAVATSHVSIKSDCREITKEVCTNTPKTVSKTVPITSCHLKQSVAREKVVKKIPKQECENVETEVVVPAPAPVVHAAPVAPVVHAAPVAAAVHAAPAATIIGAGHAW